MARWNGQPAPATFLLDTCLLCLERMAIDVAKAAKEVKENQFDEKRDTLVVERRTIWPAEVTVPAADRPVIADALHRRPGEAAKLEYVRCPTGLIRTITVTTADVDRICRAKPVAG